MTKQDRYAEALRAKGWHEVQGKSRKYRVFASPDGTLYFLGRAGAVRAGINVSASYSVSDAFKESLLV